MPNLPLGVGALKVVIRGTLYTVQDWSCALWLSVGAGGEPSQAELDSCAIEAEAQCRAWALLMAAVWEADTLYTGVTVYYYSPTSLTAVGLSEQPTSAVVPGTATFAGPGFLCNVQSLRTNLPSRSGRGRIYVPVTATSAYAGDQILASQVQNMATWTKDLLDDLRGITVPFAAGSATPVVASFTRGEVNPITRVQSGSKFEVQRRRNDQAVDTFSYSIDL